MWCLVLEILVAVLVALIPLYKPLLEAVRGRRKEFWKANRWRVFAAAILFVGCGIRLIACESFPIGLNQDEASIGYEAFAVANYGIDRNGNSLPVHFVAWASGQNALYGYLIMPLVKILGASTFAIRFPMALVGCVSLVLTYFVFRRIWGEKKSLIAVFIFAIMPWHIMKSRWGLESNIFPDLIYWAIIAVYYGLQKKQWRYFVASSLVLGVSAYAYGTAYLFIPVLCILMYGYLVWAEYVSWKDALLYVGIAGCVALPMVIFVVINYFGLGTVRFFGMTIPLLDYNRFAAITSVNGDFFSNCWRNMAYAAEIAIRQDDGFVLNSIDDYGMFYLFSLPFMIVGMIYAVRKSEVFLKLVNAFMLAAIMVAGFVMPNINRVNVLWIPMIIYLIFGLVEICGNKKLNLATICACYLVAFGFLL